MRLIGLCMAVAVVLAGCQGTRLTNTDAVAGNWASDDGVFVANFANGAFSSRLTGTGETVVADGRYDPTGTGVTLTWTSIAANERRSASCSFATRSQLRCAPSVGAPFTMTRVA